MYYVLVQISPTLPNSEASIQISNLTLTPCLVSSIENISREKKKLPKVCRVHLIGLSQDTNTTLYLHD